MHMILCDACGEEVKVNEQANMIRITVYFKDSSGISRQKDKEFHSKCWRQTEARWHNIRNTTEASA
jgi:hypothetical protein